MFCPFRVNVGAIRNYLFFQIYSSWCNVKPCVAVNHSLVVICTHTIIEIKILSNQVLFFIKTDSLELSVYTARVTDTYIRDGCEHI